jgi:hypothetical protein
MLYRGLENPLAKTAISSVEKRPRGPDGGIGLLVARAVAAE